MSWARQNEVEYCGFETNRSECNVPIHVRLYIVGLTQFPHNSLGPLINTQEFNIGLKNLRQQNLAFIRPKKARTIRSFSTWRTENIGDIMLAFTTTFT